MRLKGKAAALEVFAIIDAMDAAALAALFTDDATLVFGNAEPFVGPEQIRSGTQEFPDTVSSGDHQSLRVAVHYRFPLSLRDIEEMMAQRGVIVSYETILDQKSGSAIPSHAPRDSA